jgi:penicillin V acylase-like amidase (Ntn superfamily)
MKTKMKLTLLLLITGISFLGIEKTEACTRVVYKGPNETILTGRSMDFSMEIPANLWVLPRGIERSGEAGNNSVQWTSKYGSVVASSWDIASSDGMNEKGLVANMLWLVETEYAPFEKDGEETGLAVSLWAQYMLDNFATVAEAVESFSKADFVVVSDFIPGTNKFTTIHLSLSDPYGDNAIFEYVAGKLVIHHDHSYTVMTNDPPYAEQLAVAKYWKGIPGKVFLPGTNSSSDRYARAAFYIESVTQTDNTQVAVAAVFSVIRNVSVPYGISVEGFPNLSTTRWRVVSDQKNLVYYFENVLTPNTLWVDLKKLDFSKGAAVKKLKLDEGEIYAGETSGKFIETKPFQFYGL